MTDSTSSSVDLARFNAWLDGADLPGSGPVVSLTRLTGGAQNILHTMRRTDGTELVLRRPGRSAGPDAAKPFLRENRVLTALAGTAVPHARLHASCTDASVIGSPFSVLEKIDGFSPQGDLPGGYGSDPAWRRQMAFELVGGAARLAAVDPYAIGLDGLSRTEHWAERQVARYWDMLRGYRSNAEYRDAESPLVDTIGKWLDDNRPADVRIGIVHGDLQFANVLFAHDEPRLAAIVDWEMAGLGDPFVDLGWILTAWREEGDPPGADPYVRPWDVMPTRAELIAHYADLTGRDTGDFPWFQVLACFRLAALLEGSYVRALEGRMDRALGEGLHTYAESLWPKAEAEIARA
ncbi:phosphotransferase family protein [Yinghuangia aomiensis]|uniref:Phosphotransferase family protein n=1 Tax=Yinghuangia aomiensis TaxID=676205 RepID=A0ABP9HZS3_9ACTN